MKIAQPIRVSFSNAKELYDRLGVDVCDVLKARVESKGWFFSFRTKEVESFAQKVETGRVQIPERMEDFFACTIVVSSIPMLKSAEELVTSQFDLVSRRPFSDQRTHKAPSAFEFDDLRLYVARRDNGTGINDDLVGLVFEVQIKTMLQYAWGVATHDLIYKSDSVNWALDRIAYQVKAMLEHADVTIAEATTIAIAEALNKSDTKSRKLSRILSDISEFWESDRLPKDLKRLAVNIAGLLSVCDADESALLRVWEAEEARLGFVPNDLSPYAFTVQALCHDSELEFVSRFMSDSVKTRIVIHSGMEMPEGLDLAHPRVIVLH